MNKIQSQVFTIILTITLRDAVRIMLCDKGVKSVTVSVNEIVIHHTMLFIDMIQAALEGASQQKIESIYSEQMKFIESITIK